MVMCCGVWGLKAGRIENMVETSGEKVNGYVNVLIRCLEPVLAREPGARLLAKLYR